MSSRVTTLSVAVLALLGISMPRISCIPTSPETGAPGSIDANASGTVQDDANDVDANDVDANNVVANDSIHTLARDSVPVKLEGKWETHGGTESKSIIVVSDHGTGSTTYLSMLSKNPCVISGHEPFGSETLWASVTKTVGYFDFATGKRNRGVESNPKLAKKLAHSAKEKGVGWDISRVGDHIKHIARNHIHKVGDITEYFRHVTQYVCKAMPQDVKEQCSNKCAVVYKMFPRYVGGESDTAVGRIRYDAGQKRALELWGHTLQKMKSSPHFAMALLERDEQDRELSNFRRFANLGSFFDCSLKGNNEFLKMAKHELSGHPTLEPVRCLSSTPSAMKCLGKVLSSTGLHLDKEAVANNLEGEAAYAASQHSKGSMNNAGCEQGGMLVKLHSGVHVVKKHKERDELADKLTQAKQKMHGVFAISNIAQLVDADDGRQW